MNNAGNNPPASGQDDPWEQLAEDLFGLEYGKEHAGSAPPPAPVPQPSREPAAVAPPQVVYEARPEPLVERPAPEPQEVVSEAIADFEEDSAATVEPARPATAQDSYWDALANWTWDDGEGKGAEARTTEPVSREPDTRPEPASRREPPARSEPGRGEPAPRGERPHRPRERPERRDSRSSGRSERPAAAPRETPKARPPRDPVVEPDDFDSGLGDDAGWTAPNVHGGASPTSEAVEAGDDEDSTFDVADEGTPDEGVEGPASPEEGEGGAPRRRRRRRRRRGRGSSREGAPASGSSSGEASATEAPVPGADWDEPEGSARSTPAPPARHASTEQAPHERGNREGRSGRDRDRAGRARGDDRRHAAATPAPEDDFASEVSVSSGANAPHAEDIDDDSGEPAVSYADVPTWEEAISYLLHPQQVQVEPSGGASSPPRSADQPRQSRHYGRKHRH